MSQKFLSAESAPNTPTIIDLTSPIGTQWHELWPHYSNRLTLTSWTDNLDGMLSASDQIDMTNATGTYWFHVDAVTTTIHFTFKAPDSGEVKAETEVPLDPSTPITDPIGTRWHMIYPTYSRLFTINSWTDNGGPGVFDASDQFDFEFDDSPGVPHNAHLDAISTDIIVSLKEVPPPPVPEFPLGLGILMALAPMIPIVYIWRLRKNKPKLLTAQTNPKGLRQ
jgi:hypothetical protein